MAWTVRKDFNSPSAVTEAGNGASDGELGKSLSSGFPSLPSMATGAPLAHFTHASSTDAGASSHLNPSWSYRNAAATPRLAASLPLRMIEKPSESPPRTPELPDFAFLSDRETVRYLAEKGTRLLIIMRGVSGSGKSTLCERIVKELTEGGVRVDVASADHFFHQPDGTYQFDSALLGQAHDSCKMRCEQLCASPESQVVIVDNTSIMFWEFSPYLGMGHRYHFVTLLVEPRTAWRYDPAELAARNIHGVTESVIASKVERLRDAFVFPVYYGFMLSAVDSGSLRLWAAKLVRAMLQVDELCHVVDGEENLLVNQFARRIDEELAEWKEGRDLLHCTAFYTAYGKRPGVREYEMSDVVQSNFGKLHQLEILGLLVTSATISFHVQLNPDQLKLWNQEEELASLPRGSRAHLTVATATGVEAVQSGVDTLKLAELTATRKADVCSSIAIGKVLKFEEHFWYLALDKPKMVGSLFAGFYSRGRRTTTAPSPTAPSLTAPSPNASPSHPSVPSAEESVPPSVVDQ